MHRQPRQPRPSHPAQACLPPDTIDDTIDDTELHPRDRGQATTEYALILLAAALVAVLVIGWATAGGGAAAIGRLFDSAIDAAIDQLG